MSWKYRQGLWGICSLLCLVTPILSAPQVVEDIWEVARIGSAKAGYFHTRVEDVSQGNVKLFRTTQRLELRLKRFNSITKIQMTTGTIEKENGQVVGVFTRMNQQQGNLVLDGTIQNGVMHIEFTLGGKKVTRKIPWNDKILGLYAQQRYFQEHTMKPGKVHSFQSYEPTINAILTVRIKAQEKVTKRVFGAIRRLQKFEMVPDKLQHQGGEISLPSMTIWANEKGVIELRETPMPGLGVVELSRTTRAVATAPGGSAQLTDIGVNSMIPIRRAIGQPHQTRRIVYRITVKKDKDPRSALAVDDRQSITNVRGDSFNLEVKAIRKPSSAKTGNPGDEYLDPCYFLNSDDRRVRAYAKEAVGNETNPLKKAQRIERWVYRYMRNDNTVPFNTAADVARQLRGDCRQHAMLAAAMCRAAGIPSKTAVGLVYVRDNRNQPAFGFHMWFEAWIEGEWISLDGTLGQGSIGAAHIKIADHNWHNTQSLTPMLPVARVLGRLAIDVIRVE